MMPSQKGGKFLEILIQDGGSSLQKSESSSMAMSTHKGGLHFAIERENFPL